jgi:very-short-patch-repair endonuclease
MHDQDGRDDRILGQTAGLLAQRGDEEAVALLVDVRSLTIASTSEVARTEKVFVPDIDDGVWGTETFYLQEAVLDVDDHLVSRFTDEVCQRIAETLSYVAGRNGVEENVAYVRARPALPEVGGDWRTAYAARLAGGRPGNQARRESGGAHPTEDGLTFGSAEEQRVYRALKHLQESFPEEETISIAPLPGVRLRASHTWEPDFLVMGRGRVLVLEIDGPHHRGQRRYVDDQNRDLQWRRCGVPVVRLAVEDLQDGDALAARLREEVMRNLRRPG